jgi:hypothetical protein
LKLTGHNRGLIDPEAVKRTLENDIWWESGSRVDTSFDRLPLDMLRDSTPISNPANSGD